MSTIGQPAEAKITRVETFVVRQELSAEQQFEFSQSRYRDRTILLCRVTAGGLEGWGEAFGPALIHKRTIDTLYAPYIVGRSVFDAESLWDELYNKLRDHGQKGLSIEALSAVDIALWDLKGKVVGAPIWQLLGGKRRDAVQPYATGLYRRTGRNEIAALADEARQYARMGFTAMKLKIGFGRSYDVAATEAVRRAVGDSVDLMVDANHAYTATSAIEVAKAIEQYRIRWFEEPVPPEDIDGYGEVKSHIDIPVAGGEAEFGRYGFARLLQARAVDIAQPDCAATGGISELWKIVTLATIANVTVYPHVWGSAVALAAALNCAIALPDVPPRLYPAHVLLEWDQTPNVFRTDLAGSFPVVRDGLIPAPTGPGLGIDVDTDLIEHYRIA